MVNKIITVLLFMALPLVGQVPDTDLKDKINQMELYITDMQNVIEEHSELLYNIEEWQKDRDEYYKSIDSLFIEYDESLTIVKERLSILAQSHSDNIEIMEDEINNIKLDISNQHEDINSLIAQIDKLGDTVHSANKRLNTRIDDTEEYTSSGLEHLHEMFSRGQLYGVVALLLLGALFVVGFLLFRYKLKTTSDNVTEKISETRASIEKEGVKLDNKLLELLEKQFNVLKDYSQAGDEDDAHKLALKIADEISRIEKNLMTMDNNIKGYKQLKAAIGRMKDNMSANGYELVDLLNKPFHDGMNVIAQFYTDEKYYPNQKIITHVIKPQVNYKGKMIQAAQVEVTQGE